MPFRRKQLPAVSGKLAELIFAYIASLEARNFSKSTIKGRRREVFLFASYCAARAITEPSQITVHFMERYRKHVTEKTSQRSGARISTQSQISQLCAVRDYFRYLTKYGHMLFNPALEVELPKIGRRLPRNILSADEASKILRAKHRIPAIETRNRAMLELLYSTGMRRAELSALDIADINFESGTILIREGKGGHDRVVPAGKNSLFWIVKYLSESRPVLLSGFEDCGALFISSESVRGRISTDSVTHAVTETRKRAGIEKEGSAHMFRHTAATLMLENGADIRFIQKLLGHKELGSTQKYTHVSIRKLKEIHAKTHPARLRRMP